MKCLIYLLLIMPFFCDAQTDFKDINGKWQEEKRTKKKEKEINFSDTLRLEIRPDGFMMLRHTVGATLTGEAEIDGDKLKLQDAKFTIIESSNSKLVLKDDESNHHFRKIPEFTNAPVTKLMPGVEEGKKDVAIATVKGKWTTYKKTDPKFDKLTFYLKSIDFKEDKGNGTFTGKATFNNSDSVYISEASIYIEDIELVISTEKVTFKAKVMKSDGEEMILENGTIHYYMKQFGKKE